MSGDLPTPETLEGVVKEKREEKEQSSSSGAVSPATVTELIHRDILAAEFLVGLFWSATNSFRHDTILRPFPPMFVEGGVVREEEEEEAESQGTGEGAEPQASREGDKNKDIEGLVRR